MIGPGSVAPAHNDPLQADRERDVLRYVVQSHSAAEIGDKLNISLKTVDTYKQRISEKLGLSHRTDYVQFALKLGLLQ